MVCVDEGGKQLIGDVRPSLPTRPGKPARQDSEYQRGGVSNLFMAFEPVEARRLARRLEWHYTPKHGSWLDVAEMELSILARQCLDRRIPDMPTLRPEVDQWERARNDAGVRVNWQFTTADARIKLPQL